jgi:hypothetical protein
MPPWCRVTFFDNRHQITRTLEVQAALPLVAGEIALRWLIERDVLPEDLEPSAKIEVVRTSEHTVPLSTLMGAWNTPTTRVA